MSSAKAEIVKQDSMREIKDICQEAIEQKITEADALLESARACLASGDYTQAAVRLQEIGRVGMFSAIEYNIFDAASRDAV